MKRKDGFSGQRSIVLPQTIIKSLESDPLTAPLYITDIGYYPHAQYHFRERKEGNAQFIFIYCTKGEGWFEVNNIKKCVSKNQYFILPANTPHSYGTTEENPWNIYWIHFRGYNAPSLVESINIYPKNIEPRENSRIEYRNELFEKILSMLELGYSVEHLRYANLCLYHYLVSLMYIHLFQDEAVSGNKDHDYVSLAIHFMRENIDKKLKVEHIASELGLSSTYFSTVFQKQTGYSPIVYLNNLRIQLACKHLDFTDIKINQLCHLVGFEDAYYFSRIFTKIMSISPNEYRKRKK
jgi:AraC-like DNA-binding protein